jgi:hypothetical protein
MSYLAGEIRREGYGASSTTQQLREREREREREAMVGPAYDCFSNPLGAVRFLFEKSRGSSPPAGDWGVRDLFTQVLLQEHGSLSKVGCSLSFLPAYFFFCFGPKTLSTSFLPSFLD